MNELAAYSVIYRAEAHHDLLGHMLTYSHALNLLYDLGHHTYFHRGLPGLLKIVKVLRASRRLDPAEPIRLISPVESAASRGGSKIGLAAASAGVLGGH